MAALGQADLPEFNDDTRYAIGVKKAEELAGAFGKPELYWPGHVCERIVEKRAQSPAIVQAVAAFLRDQVRFSGDNTNRESDHMEEALKALALQGEGALPALAELVKLPSISVEYRTKILIATRFAVPEASVWGAIASMPVEQAVSELSSHSNPRWLGWLDLLAARARIEGKESALSAIQKAMQWRYQLAGSHFDDDDPSMARLPLVVASYGKAGRPVLDDLSSKVAGNYFVKEFVKQAQEAAKKPADLAAGAGKAAVTMTYQVGDTDQSYQLKLDPNQGIRCSYKDVYLNFVELEKDSKASVDPEVRDRVVKMARVLGYE